MNQEQRKEEILSENEFYTLALCHNQSHSVPN